MTKNSPTLSRLQWMRKKLLSWKYITLLFSQYKICVTICFCMTSLEWNWKTQNTFCFCFVFYNIFFEHYIIKEGCSVMFVFMLAAKVTHYYVMICEYITCEEANICAKVWNIIKIRREILMTVTAKITVFMSMMSCLMAKV